MKYIIFDTETTGLKPGQIGQLSYAIVDTDKKKATGKNFYFEVYQMDEKAQEVHGLSIEKLKELSGGKTFMDNSEEIFEDFAGKIWVGHNIQFDIKFLDKELERCQMYYELRDSFCTMRHFTDVMRIPSTRGFKFPRLEELVNFLGITPKEIETFANTIFGGFSGYHDARYDVAATTLCFLRGIKEGFIQEVA